jgi:hypothetical protein
MYKQHLLNCIEKELNICRRLFTKIPADKMNFRPKEGVRSILELLQYLSFIGSAMPDYWLNKEALDMNVYFGTCISQAKTITPEQFPTIMNEQILKIKAVFEQITEEDLIKKEVTYPWGSKAPLGEAIITTSIKWLAAYKLQLFLFIKLTDDQKLTTADAWVLSELGPM